MKRRSFLTRAALSVVAFLIPSLKTKMCAQDTIGDFRIDRVAIHNRFGLGVVFLKTVIEKKSYGDSISQKTAFCGLRLPEHGTVEDVAAGLELMAGRLRRGELVDFYKPWAMHEIADYCPARIAPKCYTPIYPPPTEESTLEAMRKVGLA